MTATINGQLLAGSGQTPAAAGQLCWMQVSLIQTAFIASGAQIADSVVVIPVDQNTGNWSNTNSAPLAPGFCYQYDSVTAGGANMTTRYVITPDTGTAAFGTLADVVAGTTPTYITPPQVATATAAAGAAANSATAAAASAAAISTGTPGGVATLDGSGDIPEAQVPVRLAQTQLDARYALTTAVTLAALGIPNVNNTADTAKPVSTMQAAADTAVLAAADKLRTVAAVTTLELTLPINQHSPVDASANSRSMTLPTGTANAEISVEKIDGSTNFVNVTGSIRGVADTISLTTQHATVVLRSDSSGAWWPYAAMTAPAAAFVDGGTPSASVPAYDSLDGGAP